MRAKPNLKYYRNNVYNMCTTLTLIYFTVKLISGSAYFRQFEQTLAVNAPIPVMTPTP